MPQPWEEFQTIPVEPWKEFQNSKPWEAFQVPPTKTLQQFLAEPPIEVDIPIVPGLKGIPTAGVEAPLPKPDTSEEYKRLNAMYRSLKASINLDDIAKHRQLDAAYFGSLRQLGITPVTGEEFREMEVTPRLQTETLETLGMGETASKITAGTQQGVAQAVDSMLQNPELFFIGALPKTIQRVAAGAFAVQMAKEVPGLLIDFNKAVQEKDYERAAKDLTSAGISGAMSVMLGRVAAAKPIELETLAPKTAEALAETKKGEPNAIQERQAAEILRDVPEQPIEINQEVPTQVGAERVPSGEQAAVVAPAQQAQALGITPSPLLQKAIEYFKPREIEAPPELRIDTEHPLPRLQPYEQEKAIASNPQSLAKVPIAGRLLDPRYSAREPVDQAIITRAYSTSKGQTFAALWAETQNRFSDLFPVERDTGTFALTDGRRGYLSDVIEAELRNHGSQALTDAQRNWIWNEYRPIQQDWLAMMREEGVKRFIDEQGNAIEVRDDYFPRSAIGKRMVEEATAVMPSGGRPGSQIQQQKKRLYETEEAGATSPDKIIYDPNPISRVSKMIASGYKAVSDTRLATDASLGGKTITQRYESLRAEHADSIGILEGEARAEFEAQLREQAAHPIWGREAQVYVAPAFSGKIFPIETARKLQKAYGESAHDWVRKAATINDAAKAMQLTADMSAPFTQGLAMMFRHPVRWAKSTANSYLSLFRNDVVAKVLEKPENLQAAQEFTQSGGSFLRLQDFMAGAEAGKFATRIPILGKVIERTGVAYGTFLDLAKLEMWKAWREGAPREQWPTIAEAIENSLFMGRMEQVGLNPGRALGERLLMLAPAYYRGAGGLVSTAFQRGVSGKMSRQMLASYASGVTLTAIAAYVAQGMSEEEIERRLDPRSGKFLKIPVTSGGGKNVEVGLGNILSSVVRLMGESVEYHTSDKPIDTGVEQNPYLRFLRAKAAFIPRLGIDAATGRDYFGNQLTIKDSLVRSFTPLVISQLFHNEKADLSQRLEDALFSFFGLQSYPEDKRGLFARERERLSADKFGKPYSELRFPQKAIVTRELNRQDRFKRDEPSAKQIEAAFAKDIERLAALRKRLTEENRAKVDRLGLRLPGYQNSISVTGVTVPLTEKEQERYEVLLGEEYNRAISSLTETNLAKLPNYRRQEVSDRRIQIAKRRARARLLSGK